MEKTITNLKESLYVQAIYIIWIISTPICANLLGSKYPLLIALMCAIATFVSVRVAHFKITPFIWFCGFLYWLAMAEITYIIRHGYLTY